MLKFIPAFDGLTDETKVEAWIYRIARNAINDYYRTKSGLSMTDEMPEIAAESDPESGVPKSLLACIRPMAENLPEKYREAIILTEFEGLNQRQLAERLDISISGAKSRVPRARDLLRNDLLECCHFELDSRNAVIDHHPRGNDGCRFCTPKVD